MKINIEDVRIVAEYMGWVSHLYSNLPTRVHKGDIGKVLTKFHYHDDWNEFMQVYERMTLDWSNIPDYKKNKHSATPYYRAIQNKILFNDIENAFILSLEFIKNI